jgi:hypothetical protein
MDGFAGNDPQTFSSGELVAPQQTLSALRSIIGHFHAGRELDLPGEIRDPETHISLCALPSRKTFQHFKRLPAS